MSMLQNRVPAGVPSGGRFAAAAHGEADIALRSVKHLLSAGQTASTVNSRAAEGVPHLELTPEQITEVQQWVDVTGDFSYRTVRSRAEEIFYRDKPYTRAEYESHLRRGGAPESSLDADAVRRDIEQARKEALV